MSTSAAQDRAAMESHGLSEHFSDQDNRMCAPGESLQQFVARLRESRQTPAPRDNLLSDITGTIVSAETHEGLPVRCNPDHGCGDEHTARAAALSRDPDASDAPPAAIATRCDPPAVVHPQHALSESSTKRKSPDHEPGLSKSDPPEKKRKRHPRDEPPSTERPPEVQDGQTTVRRRIAGGHLSLVPRGVSDPSEFNSTRSPSPSSPGEPSVQQKSRAVPNATSDRGQKKRSAGERSRVRDEGQHANELPLEAAAKESASASAVPGAGVPKTASRVRAVDKSTKSAAPGRQPKPRLTIPRLSDIKRTYKDGRPKAPVDINLATQRVHAQRQKIEDKLLCDTGGEIELAEFLERLYEFYDDYEMSRRARAKSKTTFLAGTQVFFCPRERGGIGLTARKRLQFLVAHGASVSPVFDPDKVSHIVTCDGSVNVEQVLRRAGVQSLDEIPEHIAILRWEWVEEGWKKRELPPVHGYPAFKTRITYPPDYVPPPSPAAEAAKPSAPLKKPQANKQRRAEDSDDSSAEEATAAARRTGKADPLAEFYDQARDDIDMEYLRGSAEDDEGEEGHGEALSAEPHLARKAVFQCDQKPTPGTKRADGCLNQDVIDTLAELKALHEAKGTTEDRWRVYAYQKMLRPIRLYTKRIESEEEARKITGVGEKTAKKIMEIIRTGSLRRISYERTQDVYIVMAFQGIYGVGQKTAYQWYANGCRSLDDIRTGKFGVKLSSAQEIGLRFYDDINERIPRAEVREIFEAIKARALQIDPHLFVEVMGSYRRGKETCGDIDVLITRPTSDGKTHVGLLRRLIEDLHARGLITEDLSLPDDWDDLELSYRGLCRRDATSKRRRIDFLTVPYESRGAALVYYTGDDIFNRSMRLKANKMGYSLNQRGLYKDVIRDPADRRRKLHGGTILASETEREIFDLLGVPWQEPHERVRS